MVKLKDVKPYSRDDTIATFRSFYQFLTSMYMNPYHVLQPPDGVWSHITPQSFRGYGKNDEVIDLLRRLPYARSGDFQVMGDLGFVNYSDKYIGGGFDMDEDDSNENMMFEGYCKNVPDHVVGLTFGGRDTPALLLDTQLGLIYYEECPAYLRLNASREPVDEFTQSDNGARWSDTCVAWSIEDFFEVMKDFFKDLQFVPADDRRVKDMVGDEPTDTLEKVRDVYKEHGWLTDNYNKDACLNAVYKCIYDNDKDPDFFMA